MAIFGPLSTHQNKVRHVTKESQGMDLAWGISPKFEELSDCVYFWYLSDIQVGTAQRPAPSPFGHQRVDRSCRQMTNSGH